MKKTLLVMILLLYIHPLFSYEKIHMKVSSLYVEKTGPGTYRIETSIEQRGLIKEFFEDTGVIIPLEDKVVTGNFSDDRISERNFLFAGINLDINNDGDIDDTFSISHKSGRLFIDKKEIRQLFLPKLYKRLQGISYYDGKKQPKVYKIGKKGNSFIIYAVNSKYRKMTAGIGTTTRPLQLREFPNPCIQICVYRPIENFSQEPSHTLAGLKNYISFTNEKIFDDQGGEWLSVIWAVKKFDSTQSLQRKHIFTLKGINTPFAVIIYGNFSIEKGLRMRTQPIIRIVK